MLKKTNSQSFSGKKVWIETFGCKVNTYDTGLLQKKMSEDGFVFSEFDPDIFILNTCAVTKEATQQAVKRVRKIKRQSPGAKVIVTGCSAQVDTGEFEKEDQFDLLIANSHKSELSQIIKTHLDNKHSKKIYKSNIFKKNDLGSGGGTEHSHTRAFLKIQDGCDSFCTFCVIPFARGKSQSLPIKGIVSKVKQLVDSGVKEVVCTGVHIGDYCDNSLTKKNNLEDLVEALLNQTKISRLRLSSLEPVELSESLLNLYSDKRLCPHFHMSIQSAQTEVLKEMKRNYNAEKVEWALKEIDKRVSGAFVGMDVIAGFPSETEEQFKETWQRLNDLPWTKIHVFPYSPRPNTYAQKKGNFLSRPQILQRAAQLRELSNDRFTQKTLDQVGLVKEGLVLNSGKKIVSRDYWVVNLKKKQKVGEEFFCKVTGYERDKKRGDIPRLVGEVI